MGFGFLKKTGMGWDGYAYVLCLMCVNCKLSTSCYFVAEISPLDLIASVAYRPGSGKSQS